MRNQFSSSIQETQSESLQIFVYLDIQTFRQLVKDQKRHVDLGIFTKTCCNTIVVIAVPLNSVNSLWMLKKIKVLGLLVFWEVLVPCISIFISDWNEWELAVQALCKLSICFVSQSLKSAHVIQFELSDSLFWSLPFSWCRHLLYVHDCWAVYVEAVSEETPWHQCQCLHCLCLPGCGHLLFCAWRGAFTYGSCDSRIPGWWSSHMQKYM